MNSAVRAIVRMGLYLGCEVYFIHEGYQGMVDGGENIKQAYWNSVSDIIQKGGTIIGSARCKEFRERSGRLKAAANLIKHRITALVCLGGDGSLTGANIFRKEWPSLVDELLKAGKITKKDADVCQYLQIVGLVGSIDNDFCGTDMTIGTDTALHRITEAIDCVCSTAQSHQRAFVVEVMGRHCGYDSSSLSKMYLALTASLAVDADFCFIPEWPPPLNWREVLCKKMKQMRDDGTRVNIVVVAEGAIDNSGAPITSEMVREVIRKNLHYDTRVTVLGHVQRGGNPSAFDRLLGCRMGAEATVALMEMDEKSEPCVVSIDGNQIVRVPLMKCVERTQAVKKATDQKDWVTALQLRGRSFRRNVEMYRTLTKIRTPKKKDAVNTYNIAIVNIGSPSGGMNAATRSCARLAILRNCIPYGVHNSNEGLASGQLQKMEWNDVQSWTAQGGSFLGTQKVLPTELLPEIAETLARFNIHALVLIGGFEAFHSCLVFAQNRDKYPQLRIPMCVIPCTISNNVPGTNFSLGADTSLNEICRMIDKIKTSATGSKRRVFVIETMGGHCGYLATLSAMASGADAAYIYEEMFGVSDLIEDVKVIAEKMVTGAQRYLVVRNEKASRNYTSEFIRELFCEESKGAFTTRVNVLGHTQQGGNPSPFDRIMGTKMGGKAMEHLIDQINEHKHVSNNTTSCTTPNTATLLGVIGRHECFTPVEELCDEADFPHRLPLEQWWMKLRPLLRILAKHDTS
ncbi:unnamed protein product [Anisakis simplex]|uniref:6-phosphofructokinase n=1 Tax=Anisakis simplex TaxID=6269 RepID=A0A0M3JYS9_ANISI|nr:unnamed protein product [Anisakis simplex]